MVMTKSILILTTLLLINGCGQKAPPPKKQPCQFPTFKTYKYPTSKYDKMTRPIILDNGTAIVVYAEFIELYQNKEYLKRQLVRCNKTLIRSNQEYGDKN